MGLIRGYGLLKLIPNDDLASDDTVIGRYMSLSRFIDLIAHKWLFFSQTTEFDDKLEGALSLSTFAQVRDWARQHENEPRAWEIIKDYKKFSEDLYISCWCKGQQGKSFQESIAMWRLFTPYPFDGVLVLSSVAKLKESLTQEENLSENFKFCNVDYIDHRTDWSDISMVGRSIIKSAYQKNNAYKYENELRVLHHEETDAYGPRKPILLKPDILISEIRLSPGWDRGMCKPIQKICNSFGYEFPIDISSLKLAENIYR